MDSRLRTTGCLTDILFVLNTGIAWEDFHHEMGCCGMILRNQLDACSRPGVWKKLHSVLLAKLHEADQLNWSRATVDSSLVRAVRGKVGRPRRRPYSLYAECA